MEIVGTPPNSKESEMMVLGCMLTSTHALKVSVELLDDSDFFHTQHKPIFQILKELHKSDKPADTHLVAEELKRQNKIESVGGVGYLTTLAQYAGTSAHIEAYIDVVRDKASLRQLLDLTQSIERDALSNASDVSKTIEDAQCRLNRFRQSVELESNNGPFFENLGKIIGDTDFAHSLDNRNYDRFEREHKRLFSLGGLITGYQEIDDQMYFSKGDFVVVKALSNHGKSTFMLQLAYEFLSNESNLEQDPVCIFVTYESIPIRIEEKMINIIGKDQLEGPPILYNKSMKEKYLYADKKSYRKTIMTYDKLLSENRIHLLKGIPLEKLDLLVRLYKKEYPGRTICLFLDYIQIMESVTDLNGWERMKHIAYLLESLAINREVIVFAACQVNENRQTREGRDIYNAATTVVDIFNHSHASLKNNQELAKQYKPPISNKNVCSFSAEKQKHGSSFTLDGYFLFDGFCFRKNESKSQHKIDSLKDREYDDSGNQIICKLNS